MWICKRCPWDSSAMPPCGVGTPFCGSCRPPWISRQPSRTVAVMVVPPSLPPPTLQPPLLSSSGTRRPCAVCPSSSTRPPPFSASRTLQAGPPVVLGLAPGPRKVQLFPNSHEAGSPSPDPDDSFVHGSRETGALVRVSLGQTSLA